jgi:hypothetical protein
MLAGEFVFCELFGANNCEAASPWAALRCCSRFRSARTCAWGSLLLDAPIADVALSLVLFAPDDQDALREKAMQSQGHDASGSKTKDFRAGAFLTGRRRRVFLPGRANIAERVRCAAR